tara:strand:- start:1914 stop:2207 length:294 start_codon:yes stop_codon:yes gene_type:complete
MLNNKYFYENGEYKEGSIPQECINDCSHSGQGIDNVQYWVKKLDFDFNKDQGIDYLKAYGAWDDEQLLNHNDNKERVLWIACCDMSDSQEEFYGLIH